MFHGLLFRAGKPIPKAVNSVRRTTQSTTGQRPAVGVHAYAIFRAYGSLYALTDGFLRHKGSICVRLVGLGVGQVSFSLCKRSLGNLGINLLSNKTIISLYALSK